MTFEWAEIPPGYLILGAFCLTGIVGSALVIVSWRLPDKARTFSWAVLALMLGAIALGVGGRIGGLVRAFDAVGTEHLEASEKAAQLADGIAMAMNSTAIGLAVGLPAMVTFIVLRVRGARRRRKAVAAG